MRENATRERAHSSGSKTSAASHRLVVSHRLAAIASSPPFHRQRLMKKMKHRRSFAGRCNKKKWLIFCNSVDFHLLADVRLSEDTSQQQQQQQHIAIHHDCKN
jgi:hypothetical protein